MCQQYFWEWIGNFTTLFQGSRIQRFTFPRFFFALPPALKNNFLLFFGSQDTPFPSASGILKLLIEVIFMLSFLTKSQPEIDWKLLVQLISGFTYESVVMNKEITP